MWSGLSQLNLKKDAMSIGGGEDLQRKIKYDQKGSRKTDVAIWLGLER